MGLSSRQRYIIYVPVLVPETFIKNLAILAGFLCLFIIILTIIAQATNLAGIREMVTNTVVGPFSLLIDIFALGTLLLIYIFWQGFWRNV
jgi:hypothetical protein